jgi:hypothetical protein
LDHRGLTGEITGVWLTWWSVFFQGKSYQLQRSALFLKLNSGFSEIRFYISKAPLCNATTNILQQLYTFQRVIKKILSNYLFQFKTPTKILEKLLEFEGKKE